MGRWRARRAWKTIVALALASAFAAFGVVGCSKTNAAYCEDEDDCNQGEVCSNNTCQVSFDADIPAPDASPTCPVESHQCVPLVPADWSGPTMRGTFAVDAPLPMCAVLGEEGSLLRGTGFEPSGTCECTCGTAASLSCTNARIEAVPGAAIGCSVAQCAGGCVGTELEPGVCTSMVPGLFDENNVRVVKGTVQGGSCNPGTLEPIAPRANFDETVALCANPPTDGDCGDTALCAPLAGEEFGAQTCIFREGDHACPSESGYTERTLTFEELQDGRSCGACECDLPPAGTNCGGSTDSCNIGGVSQTSTCVASSIWTDAAATAMEYNPDPSDVDCVPAVANPAISGEVTGVNPVTVCCTPEA